MKVRGRYGLFTPRPDQAPIYAKRAQDQNAKRNADRASLGAWLSKHKACAVGCGKPVAFYDEIHYSLRYSGCCSAECETEFERREDGAMTAERGAVAPHDGEAR